MNEAAIRAYGYTREEFLSMSIRDIRPPEDVPKLERMASQLGPGDKMIGVWRHRRKDGSVFDAEVYSCEILFRGTRARLVHAWDATDRLQESPGVLARFRKGLHAAPVAIALSSLNDGRFVDANENFLRLFGRRREDVLGRTSVELGMWADPEERTRLTDRLRTEGAIRGKEITIRTKDGTDRRVLLSAELFGFRDQPMLLTTLVEPAGDAQPPVDERPFRALVENGLDAIALLDPEGRFLYVSESARRILGRDPAEIVGRGGLDLVHPDDVPVAAQKLRRLLQTPDGIARAEVRAQTADGAWRWIEATGRNLLHDPEIHAVVVNYRDVSDRHRNLEALSRLATLVESSEDAIVGVDMDGTITSWNMGAERLYGYSVEESVGQPISRLVPDDRRAEVRSLFDAVTRGEAVRAETVRKRKNGSLVDVSVSLSPIRDASSNVVGMSSVSREITEAKHAENILRRSEAKFRQLFEAAADAIVLIDRRGTILDINPAGARLLGMTDPSALRGINMEEVLPAHELARAREYLRDILRDRAVAEPFETYVESPRGGRRFLEVRSHIIREAGEAPYVQIIARDVTERKEIERRLLESERHASMGEVSAFVAHEINTPLTNIALLVASLLRKTDDGWAEDKLRKLDDQRRLAASIVQDLLSVTRADEVRRVHTDVRGVVEAAAEQAAPHRRPGVTLRTELPDGPTMAAVDPLRLQQTVVHLVKNAYQATESGSVMLRLEAGSEDILIAVEDTGTGMPPEIRSRLFQAFFTTKRRGEGTGLGLMIVKKVVDAHEGSIEVRSEVGKGSAFTIRIPRRTEAEGAGSA